MSASPSGPSATADVIIDVGGRVLLVDRRFDPKGWALPGGFIEVGENAATAAVREAAEETGLVPTLTELFHVYSDPDRDPRRHTLTVVYLGVATGEPRGGDDAVRAGLFSADELPAPLAFDHARILADYFTYRRTGRRPAP
jgi:8-oxo-dGTP diphosphatase